jgi:hypothetical protein
VAQGDRAEGGARVALAATDAFPAPFRMSRGPPTATGGGGAGTPRPSKKDITRRTVGEIIAALFTPWPGTGFSILRLGLRGSRGPRALCTRQRLSRASPSRYLDPMRLARASESRVFFRIS